MYYIADFTHAKVSWQKRFKDIKFIPCKTGMWDYEYDVIERFLPMDFIGNQSKTVVRFLPLGFNEDMLPHGTHIRRVTEKELVDFFREG